MGDRAAHLNLRRHLVAFSQNEKARAASMPMCDCCRGSPGQVLAVEELAADGTYDKSNSVTEGFACNTFPSCRHCLLDRPALHNLRQRGKPVMSCCNRAPTQAGHPSKDAFH